MDDNRFDLLAKSLASGRSRRSLLRSLAAALGVAALGVEQASAAPGGVNGKGKCYGGGSQCTNAKQCCSGTCTNRVCAPEGGGDTCANKNCDDENPCTTDGCVAGQCTHTPVASGMVLATQTKGDCQILICDGFGNVKSFADDADKPFPSDNPCLVNTCIQGNVVSQPLPKNSPCGAGGVCDDTGNCLPPFFGLCTNVPAGTPLPPESQTAGDCQLFICDGAGNESWIPDDTDLPQDDLNPCYDQICNAGMLETTLFPQGTSCGPDGLVCDAMGQCVPFVAGPCTDITVVTELPLEYQTKGDCKLAICDGFGNMAFMPDDSDLPPEKPCVIGQCINGTFSYSIATPGTICGTDLVCDANGGCGPT